MHSLLKEGFCAISFLGFGCTAVALPSISEELVGEKLEGRDNVTLKVPVVATPSQHWEGVDGTWSTFEIRVGTPAQTFRVLPATSWQETWVVYGASANVCNTTVGVPPDCAEARGEFFDPTKSSTWQEGEQNELGLNHALGYQGVGQYGFDTVGLGYTADTGPTLPHQVVAAIVSDSFYFGQLGLGFQPTNQSGFGNPQASFSDTLWSNGTISSQSWSYTAGAFYRLKGVFGSLIFGGYDVARFTPNDLRFSMTGDNLRDIVVTVRGITSTTAGGNTTLMSSPEFAFIDSTLPELYLPAAVCSEFEKAFGLTLDKASGLYLLNTSQHEKLVALNPSITLTLANQKSGGETLDFVLPYAAFDLNVTSPILVNKTSKYFPLKQAPDGAYALGRVFLQETGVVAHYNSRTFQVLQSKFEDSPETNIIALPPTLPASSTPTSTSPVSDLSNPRKGLGKGAIAGIAIGAVALLAFLVAIAFFCLRRKRSRSLEGKRPGTPVVEIDTGKRIDNPDQSAYVGQASRYTSEVQGNSAKVEIQGNPIMHPQELEAEPVGMNGFVGGGRGGRTPMAELGEDELFLGTGMNGGSGTGTSTGEGFTPVSATGLGSTEGSGGNQGGDGEVSEMGDESSPNSTNAHVRDAGGNNRDTMVSMMTPIEGPSATGGFGGRASGGNRVSDLSRGVGGREGWSPVTDTSPTDSTNLERRKSRFEERFGED